MSLPTVTALVCVLDGEAFLEEALESALGQSYPVELLDVLVIDDGSTDGSAAVAERVAARHHGRVTVVRQGNAGNAGATSRGILEARGDLIALLDADDAWPVDKIARQVEVMLARPQVGLVYGDMRVIDAAGAVLQESWLAGDATPEGRCLGTLLLGNNVTASSVLIRAALARTFAPIPPGTPFADWYLAVRTAEVSELAYLAEPRTLYRFHGANMSLGTEGAERLRELCKAARFQRWCLRNLDLSTVPPAQLLAAWEAFERNAREAQELSGTPFAAVVDVRDADRREARELVDSAQRALAQGRPADALRCFLHAAALDPWFEAARDGMHVALATVPGGIDVPGQAPLAGARRFVVLALADELLGRPRLLDAYAEAMAGLDATLAIDATALDPEAASVALASLVDDAGLAGRDDVDLLALVGSLDRLGRARLAAGARAIYTERPAEGGIPAFGPDELPALRALAMDLAVDPAGTPEPAPEARAAARGAD